MNRRRPPTPVAENDDQFEDGDEDDLDGDLDDDDEGGPEQPSHEEQERMRPATPEQAAAVDALLLAHCTAQWQPVAQVVGSALEAFEHAQPQLPYIYLPVRLAALGQRGAVELQGDPMAMRASQVRLPAVAGVVAARG